MRAAAALLVLGGVVTGSTARAQSDSVAASTVYVRTDTNRTTVVTPRLRVAQPITDDTRVDLTYAIDVWTSASVDIVSAATKRVTEQRDEINAGVTHTIGTASLSANYRYSVEHDYESHGGTFGATLDLAQRNTTLGVSVTALSDDVGRSGDPTFQRSTDTLSMRMSLTQVVDKLTLMQMVYEVGTLEGYLSSPYRYVGFGAAGEPFTGTCKLPSRSCQREVNPDARTRHAVALRGRRALGEPLSLGGGYRFYVDDWDMTSHTADVDLAWAASEPWLLSVEYRLYRQGGAAHYQPFYLQEEEPKLYTSDKELAPMTSHRLGVRAVRDWGIGDRDRKLRGILSLGLTHYSFDDFIRVQSISAFESTLGVEYVL